MGWARRDLLYAMLIAAVALALRLAYVLRSPDAAWPHSIMYEGDATVWAQWAAALGRGAAFEDDLPFRTPGVAWLLHALGWHDAPFTGAKVLWCVISAATPAALFLVLARWFTRGAAVIAAVLVVIAHGSFLLANSLNNETPYALLLVVIVGGTLAWIDRPSWRWAIMLGALHGVATLLRAEHTLCMLMIVLYAAVRAARGDEPAPDATGGLSPHGRASWRIWSGLAWMVIAAVAVCTPWSIRSHAATVRFNREAPPVPYATAQPPWTPAAVAAFEALPAFARKGNFAYLAALSRRQGLMIVDESDVRAFFEREWGCTPEPLSEWSLVSLKGPLDFALANHPDADGGFSRAGLGDRHDQNAVFALARPSHLLLVNHGYEIGWQHIREQPRRWLSLAGEKLKRFTGGVTLGIFAGDWPHEANRVRRAIDLATPAQGGEAWWNTAVVACVLAGAAMACRRRGGAIWIVVVAYKVAVTIAFYGYARQAVSIAPVFCALSAFSLEALWNASIARVAWSRCCATVAIVALLVVAALTAWKPPRYEPSAADAAARITLEPRWGAGAFESFETITLTPRTR